MSKLIAADRKPWLNEVEKPFIEIKNIFKDFDGIDAVHNVSLNIYKGEFFALLGGSGSGKSTLLRIISGLESPTSGDIVVNGHSILALPANKRPINMMFQSYALFPHMSVVKNIIFGLQQENLSKAEIKERGDYYINLVQLDGYKNRMPHQLSGGQKQRVALARTLIKQPQFILLDEPLGALDNKLRERTQFELVALQEKLNLTMMVVTHDQDEAMALSTRIGVMHQGAIKQIGEPSHIYNQPNSRFVANFIGSSNFLKACITAVDEDSQQITLTSDFGKISKPIIANHGFEKSQKVEISIRPEHIKMFKNAQTNPHPFQIKATVIDVAFMGDHSIFRLKLSNQQICMAKSQQADISWDETISIGWDAGHMTVLAV